jgi:3-isopropylmalate dehydrogenase
VKARIVVLPGDGIGPEVSREAVKVLHAVAARFGHDFAFPTALLGGSAFDQAGTPLPERTLAACRDADAVLLGAVGGPQWDDAPTGLRPEDGLLGLRKALGLYANLRPVRPWPALLELSPLKAHVVRGVDLMVVRELTGGMYFGAKERTDTAASDICAYTVTEVERIIRVAAMLAQARRRLLTSVDKANVLETSRLWRSVADRVVRSEFPQVRLEHLLVDAAAMHLIREPRRFDVIVTENMFGDILSDEAAVLAGSIGLLPSASLGDGRFGLYEPIHGSAPSITNQGVANPLGTILSAAMLLRQSLGLADEAEAIESAVGSVLKRGLRTADIAETGGEHTTTIGMGDAVAEAVREAT